MTSSSAARRRNFHLLASGPTRSRPTGRSPARTGATGVRYVSQAAKLCGPEGCRRLIGENLPEDLLAVDYGHYSREGSVFAVKTILAPVIDAELTRLGKN